jgi:hypothetical protein
MPSAIPAIEVNPGDYNIRALPQFVLDASPLLSLERNLGTV